MTDFDEPWRFDIEVEIFKEIIAVKTGLKVLCKRFVNDCYGNLSMFY